MGIIKYNFKENIFSNIDTSEKAYWVGFLYADGSISGNSNTIYLALKADDKQHLIDFENFLQMEESSLRYEEKTNSWHFSVTREQTYKDLVNLGFTNEKSYDTSLNVWNNIPNKFKKDFILGLWDGDGSFFISSEGKQYASLISNNDLLIETLTNYINSNVESELCNKKDRTPGDPYPRLRIYSNKAKIFGDWLYKDISYPILQRKYNIYKTFHIGTKAHNGWDNCKTKGILCIESGKKYITAKECCVSEFGIDNPGAINNIRAVCRGDRQQTRGKHFRYLTEEERKEMCNE